ncbi:type II secretion system minor pseudopilin GspK [Saccharospirillum sp.]|uniref:type II secretion system minor pseudopilin GspK n=1 Tax=Saccharospirillum sp. TaxID=2033801 RepID=UPI0034A0451C
MKAERGFALIQVLLVFAMLAIIVARLQYEQRIQIERTYQSLFLSQAQAYIDSAEDIARVGLVLDVKDNETDHLGELWNQPAVSFPVDQGVISLEMNDLQGRFNLNALHPAAANPEGAETGLKRLLLTLGLEESIADELSDWFDQDSGAEFNYGDQEPPYTPSFQPMADSSELLLLKSVDREALATLQPYVAVLPPKTELNINTAPAEVLMTIAPFLSESDVDTFVQEREEEPYESVDDLLNQAVFQVEENEQPVPLLNDQLTVRSDWFTLYAEVTLDGRTLTQSSHILRDDEAARIVLRSQASTEANRTPGDTTKDETL